MQLSIGRVADPSPWHACNYGRPSTLGLSACSPHHKRDPAGNAGAAIQLLIDGFEADWATLQDRHLITATLRSLAIGIGQSANAEPHTVEYGDIARIDDWTFAGSLLLPASRFILHTWPARKSLWFDCFSFTDFEPLPVVLALRSAFDVGRLHWRTVDRGQDTNPDIREATYGKSAEWQTVNGLTTPK